MFLYIALFVVIGAIAGGIAGGIRALATGNKDKLWEYVKAGMMIGAAIGAAAGVLYVYCQYSSPYLSLDPVGNGKTARLAHKYTHNRSGGKIVIGRWNDTKGMNGKYTSYIDAAKAGKGTYFEMPTKVYNEIGDKAALQVNEAFLRQQAARELSFYASHSVDMFRGTGVTFGFEIGKLDGWGITINPIDW